ncbi:MAG: hypothetical protein HZB38_13370 [Planctomycetes bacterium]|nr:hypothetical protein [Planctomycetota bacterium]
MRRLIAGCTVFLVLGLGCNKPDARLNAPPHGQPQETSDMQGTFVYMVDNAMLADMSVTDAHFLPHRPQLSGLGVERVSRLAELMQAYGGAVRLSTDECDEALTTQRMQTLREFLSEAGLSPTESQGTYKPKQSGSGQAKSSTGSSSNAPK